MRGDLLGKMGQGQEQGVRHKKVGTRRRVLIIFAVVMIPCAVLAILNHIRANRSIEGVPEPIQVDIVEWKQRAAKNGEQVDTEKTIGGMGYGVDMRFLAHYDIKGLVVAVDDYDNKWNATAFDKAIPRDISLAWGKVAANKNRFKWSHGPRKLSVGYGGDVLAQLGLSRGQIMSQVSNNHLLVDDDKLYRAIKKVRVGDYIKMEGYLISATIMDDSGNAVRDVRSSLVRTDFSSSVLDRKTSCEIMYVTDLQWLD